MGIALAGKTANRRLDNFLAPARRNHPVRSHESGSLQQPRARRLSPLCHSGVEHDFPQGLVLFDEAVGSGRFLQWHDAVYKDFELS
jgi:hypothetical protein